MSTKYIINNEDGLITTGQIINGGISATTISADTLVISGSPIPQPSYKVYVALLTQTGSTAPTAIVLENTLGGDVVWQRISPGYYRGVLIDGFVGNVFFVNQYGSNDTVDSSFFNLKKETDNSIILLTQFYFSPSDDALPIDTSVEIRVYN